MYGCDCHHLRSTLPVVSNATLDGDYRISMSTIPVNTRSQIAKRRSTRMPLSAQVGLSGEDSQKCPFTMPAKATSLNRYGAAIHIPRQLLVGSTVKCTQCTWNTTIS